MLHVEPCQHRSIFMWAQSLAHISYLFGNTQVTALDSWAKRLSAQGVHPDQYTYSRFCSKRVVYLKLPFVRALLKSNVTYIGSTGETIITREANRQAKLRQLKRLQLIKAEPVLRYWHDKGNEQLFSTVIVLVDQPFHLSVEHQLIAEWQPKLNFPFIMSFFKPKATGFVQVRPKAGMAYKFNARRLLKRHRKRIKFHHWSPSHQPLKLKTVWDTLCDLASNTKRQFLAFKSLKSHLWTSDDMYLIWRVSNNVEQPHQSKIRSLLTKIFAFRQIPRPPKNRALAIPFLSHPQFKQAIKSALRKCIVSHKDLWTPFHIPTAAIREKPHQKLSKALFNHFDWDKKFQSPSFTTDFQCSCHQFLQKWPHLDNQSGHITASLSQFQIPTVEPQLLKVSGASSFYSSQTTFFCQVEEQLALGSSSRGACRCSVDSFASLSRSMGATCTVCQKSFNFDL